MINLKKIKRLLNNSWLNKKFEYVSNGIKIWGDGQKDYYKNGLLHCENGPAVITARGTVYWMQNGLKHREDGPAVIHSYGDKEWWLNGYRVR